ncbi:MAG: hypothetical protein V9G29_11535 [Burkholderiaceae bacterium]
MPGSGRDPLAPLPAADQRAALDLLGARLPVGRQPAHLASPAAASWLSTTSNAGDAALRGDGTPATALVTDFSLASQVHRAAAQRARPAAERRRGRRGCSTARTRLPSEPTALRLSELYRRSERRRCGAELAASRATSRRCAANCSAITSTASRRSCCARSRIEPRRRTQPARGRRRQVLLDPIEHGRAGDPA